MTDGEFLQWLFDRLVRVHGENPNYDYMHKLARIIEDTHLLSRKCGETTCDSCLYLRNDRCKLFNAELLKVETLVGFTVYRCKECLYSEKSRVKGEAFNENYIRLQWQRSKSSGI